MIAVDTSALVAIVLDEAERIPFSALIRTSRVKIGGPTLAEARIVVETKGGATGLAILDRLLSLENVTIEPFTERHAEVAHKAHRRFGKGRGHQARLNICDCFAYAVAAFDDIPLLFKGDDFIYTDIRPAYLP